MSFPTNFDTFTDTGAVGTFPNLAASGFIGFRLFGDGDSVTRSIDDFGGGTYIAPIRSQHLDFDYSR